MYNAMKQGMGQAGRNVNVVGVGFAVTVVLLITYCVCTQHLQIETSSGTTSAADCPADNKQFSFSMDSVYSTDYAADDAIPEAAAMLGSDLVPNVVYMAWCENVDFDFRHFLSVLSVVRSLRPDTIFFEGRNLPRNVTASYYTWFQELVDTFPHFIPNEKPWACQADAPKPSPYYIIRTLNDTGGVYVTATTWLNSFPSELRRPNQSDALSFDETDGILVVNRAVNKSAKPHAYIPCSPTDHFSGSEICVSVPSEIFPESIWFSEEPFARLARRLVYGSPDKVQPQKSNSTLAPNIAHSVWVGDKEVSFKFYLSILSVIYVGQVDAVYVHNDGRLSGEYWDRVKGHPKVKVVYHHPGSNYVYGQQIAGFIQHWSDVIRLEVLIKYGGLYLDSDAVLVQPLTADLRSYDAVISKDFPLRNKYPDSLSNGAMLGKPNARFFRYFLRSFKWLNEGDFFHNGIFAPYKVAERHPDTVRIEPRLEVQCSYETGTCHPTWMEGYHFRKNNYLTKDVLGDWRHDAFVYHLGILPPALESAEYCRKPKDITGEICRFVLETAGEL